MPVVFYHVTFLCPVPVRFFVDNYVVFCLVSELVFLMSSSPVPLLSCVDKYAGFF